MLKKFPYDKILALVLKAKTVMGRGRFSKEEK